MKRKQRTAALRMDRFIVEMPVIRAAELKRLGGLMESMDHTLRPMLARIEEAAAKFLMDDRPAPPAVRLRVLDGGLVEPIPWPGTLLHVGHRRLLEAAAARKGENVPRGELAVAAGYKVVTATLANYLAHLNTRGLLMVQDKRCTITTTGLAALGKERLPDPLTPAERLHRWCALLPDPAQRLMRILAAKRASVPLAEAARLARLPVKSAGLRNIVAMLHANALIEKPGPGLVRVAGWLVAP